MSLNSLDSWPGRKTIPYVVVDLGAYPANDLKKKLLHTSRN